MYFEEDIHNPALGFAKLVGAHGTCVRKKKISVRNLSDFLKSTIQLLYENAHKIHHSSVSKTLYGCRWKSWRDLISGTCLAFYLIYWHFLLGSLAYIIYFGLVSDISVGQGIMVVTPLCGILWSLCTLHGLFFCCLSEFKWFLLCNFSCPD